MYELLDRWLKSGSFLAHGSDTAPGSETAREIEIFGLLHLLELSDSHPSSLYSHSRDVFLQFPVTTVTAVTVVIAMSDSGH